MKTLFAGKPLDKYRKILKIAYPAAEKVFSKRRYSIKAFEICGLFPFNPNAIQSHLHAPATIYAVPKPATVTSGALALESSLDPPPATVTSGALESG